jgi:hypothetical protein
VYAVLVEQAGHFRKKLGILDSVNTGLAKWSSFSRLRKSQAFSENAGLKKQTGYT